ncbi:MAG: helix-turn-helix transcriptional regulator [Bacteroidota bacterium]
MPKPYNLTATAIMQNIRGIRIAKQYSQDYVAAKLNISQNAYSKMELGYTEVSVERLLKLVGILEVDIVELLSPEMPVRIAPNIIRMKSNSLWG